MAATSSTAIQGDVPSASELMEPADNQVNSESDSASNDSPVVIESCCVPARPSEGPDAI